MPNAFDVLSLMRPFDIDVGKVRIGGERDGGYVLADIPSQADVLSFGVGPDVTFEYELAGAGRRIFMHDHTVDGPPQQHERFAFARRGICGEGYSTIELAPLSEHVASIGDLSRGSILKVDIEGFEWEVFATLSQQQLRLFDQIVVEVHWLISLLKEPNVRRSFEAINEQFTLFHVHANNCAGIGLIDGLPVPDVLELSFVRTSLVRTKASQTLFPTILDKSNKPGEMDYPLFYFPFMPSSPKHDDMIATLSRIATDATSVAQ